MFNSCEQCGKKHRRAVPLGEECRKPYIKHGYVMVYKPYRTSSASEYKREHRVIMEDVIGRPLHRGEVVHHRNGVKTDNRLENLQLMTHSEHAVCHLSMT